MLQCIVAPRRRGSKSLLGCAHAFARSLTRSLTRSLLRRTLVTRALRLTATARLCGSWHLSRVQVAVVMIVPAVVSAAAIVVGVVGVMAMEEVVLDIIGVMT